MWSECVWAFPYYDALCLHTTHLIHFTKKGVARSGMGPLPCGTCSRGSNREIFDQAHCQASLRSSHCSRCRGEKACFTCDGLLNTAGSGEDVLANTGSHEQALANLEKEFDSEEWQAKVLAYIGRDASNMESAMALFGSSYFAEGTPPALRVLAQYCMRSQWKI